MPANDFRAPSAARRAPARRTLLFLLAFLLSPSISFAQTSLDEIRRAENALASALIEKDRATFERLLAPEFVLRGAPDTARDAWIGNAVSMCWGDDYEISDLSIAEPEGDTIVASLVLTTYQDPVTCDRAVIRSLLTDVWVRRDGRLLLRLRHSGPAGSGVATQFAKTAPPPPRWEGTAELSLVATGGNTDTQTVGAGSSFIWRPGAWVTRGRAAFVRSVADDAVTAESLVAELRQSRKLSARAEAFGRVDYLVNRFAGIDFRFAADGGIGWTIRDTPVLGLKIDAGAGFVHESRLTGEDQTYGVGTGAVYYRWRIFRTTTLEERGALSSGLTEPGNWLLQNTASLSVEMTRRLSVKLSHDLKRVARPAPGFRKTDTVLAAALVARF